MGLERETKTKKGRKRWSYLGLEKRYLGLEVKDMVGDCKVVFQSKQERETVSFVTIMMTMRIEHMKCYDDDDDVLLHVC